LPYIWVNMAEDARERVGGHYCFISYQSWNFASAMKWHYLKIMFIKRLSI